MTYTNDGDTFSSPQKGGLEYLAVVSLDWRALADALQAVKI